MGRYSAELIAADARLTGRRIYCYDTPSFKRYTAGRMRAGNKAVVASTRRRIKARFASDGGERMPIFRARDISCTADKIFQQRPSYVHVYIYMYICTYVGICSCYVAPPLSIFESGIKRG